MSSNSPGLSQALKFSRLTGMRVFPIYGTPESPKAPGCRWAEIASSDADEIREAFDSYTEAYGVVYESDPEASARIQAIDIEHGQKGAKSHVGLEDWLDWQTSEMQPWEEDCISDAWQWDTASGGRVILVRSTGPEIRRGTHLDYPDIEVRGGTGNAYHVGPGSRLVNGQRYGELRGGRAGIMPPSFARGLPAAAKRRKTSKRQPEVELDREANTKKARKYLREQIAKGEVSVEGQGGNNTAIKVLMGAFDYGVSKEKLLDLVEGTGWNEECDPPWSDEELEVLVENAWRYRSDAPGSKTPEYVFKDIEIPENSKNLENSESAASRGFLRGLDETDGGKMPNWIIEDLIPENSVGILYGPPGSHKSFVGGHVAAIAALGLTEGSHGLRCGSEEGYRTAILAIEDWAGMDRRIKAFIKDTGHEVPTRKQLSITDGAMIHLDGDDGVFDQLAEEISELRPKLIIIDTLKATMLGNENDQGDAQRYMERVQRLRRAAGGATVLLIHHTGKDRQTMRGSVALEAATDFILSMDTNSNTEGAVRVERQRIQSPAPPIGYRTRKVNLASGTGDTLVLDFTPPVPAEQHELTEEKAKQAVRAKVGEILETAAIEGTSRVGLRSLVKKGVLKTGAQSLEGKNVEASIKQLRRILERQNGEFPGWKLKGTSFHNVARQAFEWMDDDLTSGGG